MEPSASEEPLRSSSCSYVHSQSSLLQHSVRGCHPQEVQCKSGYPVMNLSPDITMKTHRVRSITALPQLIMGVCAAVHRQSNRTMRPQQHFKALAEPRQTKSHLQIFSPSCSSTSFASHHHLLTHCSVVGDGAEKSS